MIRGAPSGSLGLANPSGLIKSRYFAAASRHFVSCIIVSKENPEVLVMDNHSCHISKEVTDIAKDYGISLLTPPPYCSHKLHSLDVRVFGLLKNFLAK